MPKQSLAVLALKSTTPWLLAPGLCSHDVRRLE